MIRGGIRRVFHLALRRRDRWEREVEDEIKLHLTLRAEQLVAEGYAPEAAYDEAVRRFGPLEESRVRLFDVARHRETRMHRTEYLSDLRQDVMFALRALRRQRGWAAVTVGTLALGVAATTAVFSVVSTLLLHPLSYPHADRIAYVELQPTGGSTSGMLVTLAAPSSLVRAWMSASHSFEAFEGIREGPMPLKTESGEPSIVRTATVFPTFAAFAGARPILGRMFSQADIERGGHVVVLGEGFWRTRLGGKPDVLGRTLTFGDSTYTIVGVLPATLDFGAMDRGSIDAWLPLDVHDDRLGMSIMARLGPGATIDGASIELDSISARWARLTNETTPFRSYVSSPANAVSFRDSLLLLTGAVALVLLVACANVAHLLLARAATRQREQAIRMALGASLWRIVRQSLAENILLTATGVMLGVAGGWIGLRVLIALRPRSLDALAAAHLDTMTLGVAAGVAIVSAALFTLLGFDRATRQAAHESLKSGGAAVGVTRGGRRTRSALVLSEMAVSATLLVGATLLTRTVIRLQHAELGFAADHLFALDVPMIERRYESPVARAALMRDFMTRLSTVPGVRAAALANVAPGSDWVLVGRLQIDGVQASDHSTSTVVKVNTVQPRYFEVMGTHLLTGTTFTDTSTSSRQVIVNAGFARRYWPLSSAIGRRVRVAQSDTTPWLTIVGVANDVQTSGPAAESTTPVFYSPMTTIGREPQVLVRTTGVGAAALGPAVTLLHQLGVAHAQPAMSVHAIVARTIAGPRFVMTLLSAFTGIALVLAAIGLYGMMAYTVAQQTREIGIRMALGAPSARIAGLVVGRGAGLAITGAVVGLAAAAWATKLLERQLFGVTRLDPVSFATGGMVLIGAALVACIVPARRALAVDPVTAIRAE